MMPPEWPLGRDIAAVVLLVTFGLCIVSFGLGVRYGRRWESQERQEAYEAFQREAKHWQRK